MKNFGKVIGILYVGFLAGMIYEDHRMANDEDYHDYWMKRCKKTN